MELARSCGMNEAACAGAGTAREWHAKEAALERISLRLAELEARSGAQVQLSLLN